MIGRTSSPWRATHQLPRFAPLSRDAMADVVIVGAGISGLTAAVRLSDAGLRVVVLEREGAGSGESGNTTAHLTEAVDARYQAIRRDFGEEGGRLVAQSSREAIAYIESLARGAAIDCGFARVPGYLYAERSGDVEQLADELDAARRAGCAVRWVDRAPLPFATHGAIEWEQQAQIHATAYLDALIAAALAHGVKLYNRTRVVGVYDGEPCTVETEHGRLSAAHVFVAANVPINNRVWLHTKIAAYRSYAIAVTAPAGIESGLFWDSSRPYHYTRTHAIGGERLLIVGGEDHRTGANADTDGCYARLVEYARSRFGATDPHYRWSGQIIEPVDGLPYIGLNTASQHVYVATGYSGNGFTFGTLAGLMIGDRILGRENRYAGLYAATRVKPLASALDYISENVVFPARLVADRLTSSGLADRQVEELAPGEGAVFTTPEGKVAVCRDDEGGLHSCSAVCTHLGCDVAWNPAERTWDCPCHGSRFTPQGTVINGPAVNDLSWKPIPASTARR